MLNGNTCTNMKAEEFEQEWKRYCDSKGGGAVTMNIKDAAKHFADWQKEQMMKEAIDSEVKWCNHGYPDFPIEDLAVLDEIVLSKEKFQIGDKVKVIIIKE